MTLVRMRWAIWGAAALVGLGAGIALIATRSSGSPASTSIASGPAMSWAAGTRRAPSIALTDENGKAVTLAAYRGRNVIVTFIDPVCTTLCPIESHVVDRALAALPASSRPAVLAVSVNPPHDGRATLKAAVRRFRWMPQWRWAVGSKHSLAGVWKSYAIEVIPTKGDVTHTEAAYVVDKDGFERALYLWPFSAADLRTTLEHLK